jgi:glycosyltransferase involved in cell wall biosynthesis
LLPYADRLIVMAERHRREFPRAEGRISVVHNAILRLPTKGSPLDVTSLRRVGVPLLGVIGRLSPEKGIDILLQAVSLLPSGAVSLVIAGEGLARASLEQQARRLGIGPHVHFVGTVEDVGSLYPQLDLVVVPSRSEGLPNVLLEALSADIPVVATAVGAIPEVLTDKAAGQVVPPCDAQALADAIMRTLAEGRSDHARVARAAMVERFSLRKRVEHHLCLYGELRPELLAQNSLN